MKNSNNQSFLKAKKDYVLRKIADENILVPIGKGIANFSGVIYVNDSAAFLWKLLQSDTTIVKLEEALVAEYKISEKLAKEDVQKFIDILEQHNMLED